MPWSTHNVNTASKDLYDQILEKREDLFPQQTILFQIAASIGLKRGEKKKLNGKTYPLVKTTAEAFDRNEVLKNIMNEKYPEKTEKEILTILEEYAESGIQVIYTELSKTGTFDIEQYLE